MKAAIQMSMGLSRLSGLIAIRSVSGSYQGAPTVSAMLQLLRTPIKVLISVLAGCIRLWDTKLASSDPVNGRILAQSDDDVATFSLGDIFEGEVPIIL